MGMYTSVMSVLYASGLNRDLKDNLSYKNLTSTNDVKNCLQKRVQQRS